MNINGLLGFVLCSFLISSGVLLIGPQGGRLHPDLEAQRDYLMRDIRDTWKCPDHATQPDAVPALIKHVTPKKGCFASVDFELFGRAVFEVKANHTLRATPMTAIRQNMDLLARDTLISGIAQSWAADAVIHQYAIVNGDTASFKQRSVKYGDHNLEKSPGSRRTQVLISALVTAIVAPELANTDVIRWKSDGQTSTLSVRDQGDTLNWTCNTTGQQMRCETAQAELSVMGKPGLPWKLSVALSNWTLIGQQTHPRDWVISWGDQDWVEYRGTLEAVRREPPPDPTQPGRPT